VLKEYIEYFKRHGYGMLAITERETGAYLGEVGIWDMPIPPHALLLRYAIVRPGWGNGVRVRSGRSSCEPLLQGMGP
jgi:RimJ/RimL family protein N-acetyltransferase